MSNYFQTLNRLERDRGNARAVEELTPEQEQPAPAAVKPPAANARAEELAARPATEGLRRRQPRRSAVVATPAAPAAQPKRAAKRIKKKAVKANAKTQTAPQQAALERAEAAAQPVAAPQPAPIHIPEPAPARRRIAKQSLLDASSSDGDGHTPFLKLFDNLRARSGAEAVSTVVLVAAGTDDTATAVTTGLATLARRRSLTVLVGDVEEGMSQPVLNPRNRGLREQGPLAARAQDPTASEPFASSIALNLRGGPVAPDLEEWLLSARTHHDLVILEAPPLGLSVDGALLARACDGLVIVVDPATTTKEMLRKSVERANGIGCRILGLVMNGTRADLPGWMGRMSGARPQA